MRYTPLPMLRRASLVGLIVVGCGETLDPTWKVDSLRILALTTPTPTRTQPGDITVTARWFDPQPMRRRAFVWRVCPAPEGVDARRCAEPGQGTTLTTTTDDTVTLTAAQLPNSGSVLVWVMLCPEAPATVREGRYQCAGDEGFEAVRKLSVGAVSNRVPTIAAWSLTVDGTARSLLQAETTLSGLGACEGNCPALTLTVTPGEGSAESVENAEPERLLASFLTTHGTLSRPRDLGLAGEVRPMTARFTPDRIPGTTRLWTVLRDQRGGDAVVETTLRIEP